MVESYFFWFSLLKSSKKDETRCFTTMYVIDRCSDMIKNQPAYFHFKWTTYNFFFVNSTLDITIYFIFLIFLIVFYDIKK